jgi:hypothetical protein
MTKYFVFALVMFFIPLNSQASEQLPDLGEPYDIEIQNDWIIDAILDANFKSAAKLIQERIYQELKQRLYDEKTIAIIVSRLAQELEKILNDPNKTDAQKGEDIIMLINASMEDYKSTPEGNLNLEFKHSIEYGVTRLTWDKKIETDTCKTYYAEMTCTDWYGSLCWGWEDGCSCSYSGYYKTEYVKKEPDYYIYRIINNQETLITKLLGNRQIKTKTISFSEDIWDTAKSIYDFTQDVEFDVGNDKAFFYDMNSDYRNVGDSFSYKVVTDNSPYKYGNCGSSESYVTISSPDSDANGRMDFIPDSEYAKYFGKYYGWLIPVITMLN